MKKLKLIYAWLNYQLSWYTHHNKQEYRLSLYFEYRNLKNELI